MDCVVILVLLSQEANRVLLIVVHYNKHVTFLKQLVIEYIFFLFHNSSEIGKIRDRWFKPAALAPLCSPRL